MTGEQVRVLLADDHAVLRSGPRLLLSNQDGLSVVGEASTGAETLGLAESLQPDLILLDLSMPSLGGLQVLPLLRRVAPQARVLMLPMHDIPQYLRRALHDGAAGYVLKKAADTELLAAVQAVLRGEIYVHPALTRSLIEDILPPAGQTNDKNLWDALSEREKEVLRLVALGFTGAEIAEQLSLSAKTVETYRARGMEKLGMRNRAALVRFALHHSLISPG